MYWADKEVEEIRKAHADAIGNDVPLIVRDEKTASGRVHVGSMRGVAVHGEVAQVLHAEGIPAKFLYEINDFDPMDGIPTYLDQEKYKQYLGAPLYTIPAPDGKSENFAEQYAAEFQDVIEQSGFTPEYYRASSLYRAGKMNEVIMQALEGAETIRRIYVEVAGSQKPEGWLPISMVCEKCGKVLTTKPTGFDGTEVQYECVPYEGVGGSIGCGHEGSASPLDGKAKLPWKVEWSAKWKVMGVHIEGAGKDHSTKGGSRDVANAIGREVFDVASPYDIPYEFFLVGGAKMSSSKGQGSAAGDVARILPTKIFRLALLGTLPKRAINLDPAGDTIPTWFDWYDKIAAKHWEGVDDDEARLFVRVHHDTPPSEMYLPRFSSVAFLVQMEHLNLEEEVSKIKETPLTEEERKELSERATFARMWLKDQAPDKYRFELQKGSVPEAAMQLNGTQKQALGILLTYIEETEQLDGPTLHAKLHDIKTEADIAPKELFSAIYQAFLGRDSGPQAGWFLSTLEKAFLLERLRSIIRG